VEYVIEFIKYFLLRWYCHGKRMQNQRTPRGIATATLEGNKEMGRPCKCGEKRLRGNKTGIKTVR
jgi:hypothetical protein